MTIFAECYRDLISQIMSANIVDVNLRTDTRLKLLPQGHSFSINLSNNVLPTCGLRRTRPHIAAAEAAWCFRGEASLDWLQKHTKVWNVFADDNNDIMEAYGHRWRYAFAIDQIQTAITRLLTDPTDRRIWISSYHPTYDLRDTKQKTVPCPVGFTLSVCHDRLNSSYMIRSSDVIMGLPLDVMRHALVMRAIACSMQADLGHMRVCLAHPHIYESHWVAAEEMLKQEIRIPNIQMPMMSVDDIADYSDQYVNIIRDAVWVSGNWPDFDPTIRVVK
jgi:thymidylate synthase